MAILGFDGLTWAPLGAPPSRTLLVARGYYFYEASARVVSVVADEWGPAVGISGGGGGSGFGAFGRPAGGASVVGFLVRPDFVYALGSPLPGFFDLPVGSRSRGVGFARNAAGAVALAFASSGAGVGNSYRVFTPWVSLPADVWDPGRLNTVYIARTAAGGFELHINDFGPAVSASVETVAGASAFSPDYIGYTTNNYGSERAGLFSLPIACTQPEGPLSFKTYRPAVDGPTDFTPDTGTEGYARINDEMPDGDESYVEATEDGAYALYEYRDEENTPIDVQSQQKVHGVRHYLSARVAGADTRYLTAIAEMDGNREALGTAPVFGSYTDQVIDLPINPISGAAWQPEDFNGLMLGFQIDDEAE